MYKKFKNKATFSDGRRMERKFFSTALQNLWAGASSFGSGPSVLAAISVIREREREINACYEEATQDNLLAPFGTSAASSLIMMVLPLAMKENHGIADETACTVKSKL